MIHYLKNLSALPLSAALLLVSLTGCSQEPPEAQPAPQPEPPFTVAESLFDHSDRETLGLARAPGAQTFTAFRPGDDDPKYNHAAVALPFKGQLYLQWQSSEESEDTPDTFVAYAVSDDGETWSEPKELFSPWEGGYKSSGGWWSDGETLVAYALVWPHHGDGPRGGYTEYRTSTDGVNWTEPKRILASNGEPVNGVMEQDLDALADGRIITAVHEQPGLIIAPYYTDDPLGISGWTRGEMENLPHEGDISRGIEPSWYVRSDGAVVMVFRDQASSFKKLASISHDRGETWSTPVVTDMPDSRSKQSAGNLPSGAAYFVSNPTNDRPRIPLALTLSKDGFHFDRAFLLRAGGDDLQPQRQSGTYKSTGYSYPKSVVWGDWLYVAYAANKEDIEVTRIPLAALRY